MNTSINIYTNKDAKKIFNEYFEKITKDNYFKNIKEILNWKDKEYVQIYVYFLNKTPVSFILLSYYNFYSILKTIDINFENIDKMFYLNANLIDYYFTLPDFRNNGYFSYLLNKISNNLHIFSNFTNIKSKHEKLYYFNNIKYNYIFCCYINFEKNIMKDIAEYNIIREKIINFLELKKQKFIHLITLNKKLNNIDGLIVLENNLNNIKFELSKYIFINLIIKKNKIINNFQKENISLKRKLQEINN